MQIMNLFLYSEKTTTKNLTSQNHLLMSLCEALQLFTILSSMCVQPEHLGLLKIPLSRTTQLQVLCNLGLFHCIFFYFEELF